MVELRLNRLRLGDFLGGEAGLFQQAGLPAIICGPGDISRAHRPEEYLTEDELHGAVAMILTLGRTLSA